MKRFFLTWPGLLISKTGPALIKVKRLTAYIVILGDKTLTDNFGVDHGIAAHSVMLAASQNEGLGGCIIASITREELCADLRIPDKYEVLLIVALGKPVEKVVVDEIKDDDVKYSEGRDQKSPCSQT